MLTVVAALIESNGKLLVCQRRRGAAFEMMWEFPGGKKKSGETLQEALARELREELGLSVRIGPEIFRTRHQYAEMNEPIELVFFTAVANTARMQNRVFEQIEWRHPQSLAELNFLPADQELIEKLSNGSLPLPGTHCTGTT
ncbi:MAG: (deoxy)nucleoside triphosphate pyrophosphohydrolase [Candidatus Acidiferrales bacterium]